MPSRLNSHTPGRNVPLIGMRSPTFHPNLFAVAAPAIAPCLSLTKLFHSASVSLNSGNINGKLGEEISLILVHTTKPVGVRNPFHAGHATYLVHVGKRQGLDDGNTIDDYQAISACNLHTSAECCFYNSKEAKEHQRNRERADRERQPQLLAKQVGKHQSAELHRAPPEKASNFPASTRTPLSRWSVTSARSATTGSCVTISTVFLYC